MAAGHAPPDQCAELLRGLLKRGRRRAYSGRVRPLAVACMQTARRLDPQLRADIERLAERLVPPATSEAAEALAGAGEMLLDLLRAKPPRTPAEAAASIRAASRIGGQAALRLIGDILARHAAEARSRVDDEVIAAWRFFKPDLYVKEVLARSWPPEKELPSPGCRVRGSAAPVPGAARGPLRAEDVPRRRGTPQFVVIDAKSGVAERSPHRVRGRPGPGPLAAAECPGKARTGGPSPPAGTGRPGHGPERMAAYARVAGLRGSPARTRYAAHSDVAAPAGRRRPQRPQRPAPAAPVRAWPEPLRLPQPDTPGWDRAVGGPHDHRTLRLPAAHRLRPAHRANIAGTHVSRASQRGSRDLSPLTSLPRLKTLSLRGQNTFDVSSLAGIRDLAITVPPRARVTGADRLGPMSRITDSEYIDSAAESQ